MAQHSKLEVTALSDSTATFNRDGILAATSSVIHNIVAGNSISGLTVVNSVYGSNTIIGNGTTILSVTEPRCFQCRRSTVPKQQPLLPRQLLRRPLGNRLAVAVATAVDSKRKP